MTLSPKFEFDQKVRVRGTESVGEVVAIHVTQGPRFTYDLSYGPGVGYGFSEHHLVAQGEPEYHCVMELATAV